MDSKRPTYPELLKFFYGNFPDLSLSAHSIGLAIIHKSNELYYPASFRMSNKELSMLSKVRESNIGRSRQVLLEHAIIDGVPFFTYISAGRKRAGLYKINFTLTSDRLHLDFTLASLSLQNTPQNDNDHNELTNEPTNSNCVDAPLEGESPSDATKLKKLAEERWRLKVKLSDSDCRWILEYTADVWPVPKPGKEWTVETDKTPMDFWEEVIRSMSPDGKSTTAGSIRKYGEKMWLDWKREHIQFLW